MTCHLFSNLMESTQARYSIFLLYLKKVLKFYLNKINIIVILYSQSSTANDILTALNDLPTLSPNLVTNVNSTTIGNDRMIVVTYSAALGLNKKNLFTLLNFLQLIIKIVK